MDRLWAPWRIKYILSPKDEGCFICEAIKKPEKDKENLVLYRSKNSLVIMNKYPYNNGHILIAPFEHNIEYENLNKDSLLEINILSQKMIKVLKSTLNPDGFNLGYNFGRVSGAGLEDHIHLHIVPRWNGDTNFMPVLDDTRVISEALLETYNKLLNKTQELLCQK